MIRPSQRGTIARNLGEDLALHKELARTRDRHRRLLRASVTALLAALLTWVADVDLVWRAGLAAASWLVVFALPTRGSETWALQRITAATGLAYQTALEYAQRPDDFGFVQALRTRAGRSVAGMEPIRHSHWWLPVLVLTVAILLLPSLGSILPAGGLFGTTPSGATQGATSDASQGERPDSQEAAPAPVEEETRRVDRDAEPGDSQEEAGDVDSAADGASSDQGVLDRFLENLRERPPREGQESESSSQGQPSGQETGRQLGEGERSPGEPQGGESQGQPGEEGQAESRQQEGTEGQDPQGQQGEGGDDGSGQQDEQQNPFGETGSNEDPRGEREEESGGEGMTPEAEEGAPKPDSAGDALQAADEGGEGEGGQGAGGVPTGEQEVDPAGRAQGEELFIEGDLRPGETNLAGEIQLPGSDEVDIPAPSDPGSYRRAVERAVSEGRIPLEYQEIIRNYFR